MVYEKIKGCKRINKLNQNCIRNIISIDGLCNELLNIIKEKEKVFLTLFQITIQI